MSKHQLNSIQKRDSIPEEPPYKLSTFEDFGDRMVKEYYRCLRAFDDKLVSFEYYICSTTYFVLLRLRVAYPLELYDLISRRMLRAITPRDEETITLMYEVKKGRRKI